MIQKIIAWPNLHQEDGIVSVKFFFPDASKPSLLIVYDIPLGVSEGVHAHNLGDVHEGSIDEFYYIVSGEGEMEIENIKVAVNIGDHIFTSNGVPHGIRNNSLKKNLKVFLTAVIR